MQSEQWHPSDIEKAAGMEKPNEDDSSGARRRGRPPASGEAPASTAAAEQQRRPSGNGIMSLDPNAAQKSQQQGGAEAAAPVADVAQRLRETAERCMAGYAQWKSGNDGEGELTNSLHELRRVLARIEIELAANHADDTAQRPIPIPLHRAHNKDRF